MSKVDKQALRELAEKARTDCGIRHEANCVFIEAASPAAVLALLDEIETLEGLYHMHRETEERQMIELRAEVAVLRRDAGLYRALRAMHWHSSPLAVVRNPKEAVKPGHDCPSGDRLDEAIEMAKGGSDLG